MADNKDLRLVNILQANSRLSCREIAKRSSMSVVTVINRLKDMEEQKVIRGYSADLDYDKLGFDVTAIIKLRISKGKLFEVENKIATEHCVFAVYDITGNFDCLVLAKFKSSKALDQFLKKIQKYDFVVRTETNLVLNTIVEKKIMVV